MFQRPLVFLNVLWLSLFGPGASAQTTKNLPPSKADSPFVTALSFSQRYAKPEVLVVSNDSDLKLTLIAALKSDPTGLSWQAVGKVFERSVFQNLAGDGNRIKLENIEQMMRDTSPLTRQDLFPKVRQHADLLVTQFNLIDEKHRGAAEDLVAWMTREYNPAKELAVFVICTGNSRRSMLGSTMGNVAASYYGLPKIRFYSGGTTPSAFNSRAIATLKEIGVEIDQSGIEAPRGDSGEENPIYNVTWGKGQESREYSKKYSDSRNPQKDFAALLVCSEADAVCPTVVGASKRIPLPYMDPKIYDGAPFEAAKYAERRDDMGRFMLSVLMQVSRRLEIEGKLKY
jgi:arsenate reductase